LAERSAARLAHQSGGLGVPSSNLGAPTKKNRGLSEFHSPAIFPEISLGKPVGRLQLGFFSLLLLRVGSVARWLMSLISGMYVFPRIRVGLLRRST
jgi:hypothetical protein